MNVMRDWTQQVPIRMQSTMLLALRGPDTVSKNNTAKVLIREMRFAVLHPAFRVTDEVLGGDDFMGTQTGYCSWNIAQEFLRDHDQYPHHWLMHFAHAAEIIGQYHPRDNTKTFWWNVYTALCDAFHMNVETIEQLEARLRPTGWELERSGELGRRDWRPRAMDEV